MAQSEQSPDRGSLEQMEWLLGQYVWAFGSCSFPMASPIPEGVSVRITSDWRNQAVNVTLVDDAGKPIPDSVRQAQAN